MKQQVAIGQTVVTFNGAIPPGRFLRVAQLSSAMNAVNDADKLTPTSTEQEMAFIAILLGIESASGLPFPLPTHDNSPDKLKAAWEHFTNPANRAFWQTLLDAAKQAGCLRIWGKSG